MERLMIILSAVVLVTASVSSAPVAEEDKALREAFIADTKADTNIQPEADIQSEPLSELRTKLETRKEPVVLEFEAEVEKGLITVLQSDSETKSNIERLIEEADPIENDISSIKTESPDTSTTYSSIYSGDNSVGTETTGDAAVKSLVTERTTTEVVTPTVVKSNDDHTEEEQLKIERELFNKTETVETTLKNKFDDVLILGEYPDLKVEKETVQENTNKYQIVQGENEDGTAVLSEFLGVVGNEEKDIISETPVVENIEYNYPPDNIKPSSVFRPNQSPDMLDHPSVGGEIIYDDFMHNNPMDYTDENMYPMIPDYTTENQFSHSMDYRDDFPSTPFDESIHYDDSYDGHTESIQPSFGPILHTIVAGQHGNYHPEPIMGMIPHLDDTMIDSKDTGLINNPGNLNMDYPMYDDVEITAGMVNIDPTAIEQGDLKGESINPSGTKMPAMVESPEPLTEFAVEQNPMASMETMMTNGNHVSEIDYHYQNVNDYTDEATLPEDHSLSIVPEQEINPVEFNPISIPQDEIIIKLNFRTEEALVNGKPFAIKEPSNLLGFIEKMLNADTMRPSRNNYGPDSVTPHRHYYHYDVGSKPMDMGQESDYYPFEPSYYSSYGHDHYYEPQYPMSESYNDFLPTNAFLRDVRQRLLTSHMNLLRSIYSGTGVGPSSRFQRSAPYYSMSDNWYNPYW